MSTTTGIGVQISDADQSERALSQFRYLADIVLPEVVAADKECLHRKASPDFALAKTQQAVIDQKSDLPGYKETKDGELFPFAFGLTY